MYKIVLILDVLQDLMFACILAMINLVTICLHMKL